MPRLRAASGHALTLPTQRVSVGESAANAVPIAPGSGVAAVHFHLQPWESGHFIEDAGSGLGTLVNGEPVSWAPLQHGDVITAGSLQLLYEDENRPPAVFPAPHSGDRGGPASPAAATVGLPSDSWLPPELEESPPARVRKVWHQCEIETIRDRTGPVAIGCLLLLLAAVVALVWWLVA